MQVTLRPLASSRQPMDEAASPLPRLETTPPVTKIYLGINHLKKGKRQKVKVMRKTKDEDNARDSPFYLPFCLLPFSLFLVVIVARFLFAVQIALTKIFLH